MLSGCKRILRPGGRLAFTIVATVEGTAAALSDGFDDFVTPGEAYRPLIVQAGFEAIEESDVTEQFGAMATKWLEVAADLEGDLRSVLGDDVFEGKLQSRLETRDAIEAGELRRLLFTARA